ncbi:hypothetical protein WS73_07790 [Burkholderia savannae]|nr:hypothetical protein WS73_07790 [Burkholderia savannae]
MSSPSSPSHRGFGFQFDIDIDIDIDFCLDCVLAKARALFADNVERQMCDFPDVQERRSAFGSLRSAAARGGSAFVDSARAAGRGTSRPRAHGRRAPHDFPDGPAAS